MFGQEKWRVRFEWGPSGAQVVRADHAVVVDVLSFTTTLTVAVERGIEVFPFPWKDERAEAFARERDAVLAVGRLEARREDAAGISLSPAAMAEAEHVQRIVLPSPNGSTISAALADSGATVVGASLRNRAAVGGWLAERVAAGGTVVVIASGERWPDGSLRPAVEDLWGAGAVIATLVDLGIGDLSPEARVAEAAFRSVRSVIADQLADCAGGRELAEIGFAADVAVAARLDVSEVVPILTERGAFQA